MSYREEKKQEEKAEEVEEKAPIVFKQTQR